MICRLAVFRPWNGQAHHQRIQLKNQQSQMVNKFLPSAMDKANRP
jgi:hypothetical protein